MASFGAVGVPPRARVGVLAKCLRIPAIAWRCWMSVSWLLLLVVLMVMSSFLVVRGTDPSRPSAATSRVLNGQSCAEAVFAGEKRQNRHGHVDFFRSGLL